MSDPYIGSRMGYGYGGKLNEKTKLMNQYELYVSPTLTLTVMAKDEEEAKDKCMKEFVDAREKIGNAVVAMTEVLERMIK